MKIIFGVIGLLICTCTLLCVAVFIALPQLGQNFVQRAQGPVHVKQVGAQIADYTVPPGYQEAMGMDVFTTQMMILTPVSNRGVSLALMQFKTTNVNREQMEQQMQQAMQQQSSGTLRRVGEEAVTIKGQSTIQSVSESKGNREVGVRQAIGVLSGKGGLVMLMATGMVNEWNWHVVKDFCASIR